MGGDIWNIKLCKCLDRGIAIVIGRSTNKAETGQRDHRINAVEVLLYGRATIEAPCKARNNANSFCFKRADDCIVMSTIPRQNVAAQHQNSNRCSCIALRQFSKIGDDFCASQVWVVKTNFRVIDGGGGLNLIPAAIFGVSAYQKAEHGLKVVV